MQVGTNILQQIYQHKSSYLITPRDFGYRRANNYVTLISDIIHANTLSGVVSLFKRN